MVSPPNGMGNKNKAIPTHEAMRNLACKKMDRLGVEGEDIRRGRVHYFSLRKRVEPFLCSFSFEGEQCLCMTE